MKQRLINYSIYISAVIQLVDYLNTLLYKRKYLFN